MEAIKFWMFIGCAVYFIFIAIKVIRKENDK